MFMGLYEFIFSSSFPSDLSDHWSGKDLQYFSCHKKRKDNFLSNLHVGSEEMLTEFSVLS